MPMTGGGVRGGAGGPTATRAEALSRRLALTVPHARRGTSDRLTGYYDALLAAFIPPALLVGADRRLLHTFGGAGKFLQQPDGRQTDDVFARLPADLRATAAGGFQRALRDGREVAFRAVPVEVNGRPTTTVTFSPVTHPDDDGVSAVLIRFAPEDASGTPLEDAADAAPAAPAEAPAVPPDAAETERLREELHFTRENLNALVEELEASNEELQTTNEELISSNEEMQSTNEELNSVNEELYSLNAEYQAKIRELTELSDDVENLLRSTEVHTVFLDAELRVRKFTPRAAELFNLVESDVGRRFDSFQHRTDAADLTGDLRRVRDGAKPVEREARGPDGEPYLLRVFPYRGADGAGGGAGGVVLTLVDVTALRRAERRFDIALEASGRAMVLADAGGNVVLASRIAAELFGADGEPAELVGTRFADLLEPADARRVVDADRPADAAPGGASVPSEFPSVTARRPDGSTFTAALTLARAEGEDGRYLLASFVDVTGRDELRQDLRRREHELRAVLENSHAAIFIKDLDGRYEMVNSYLADLAGRTATSMLGKTDAEMWPPEFAERYRAHDREIIRTGRSQEFAERLEAEGEIRDYVSLKFPVFDDEGRVIGTGGVATDITVQKRQTERAEKALSQRDTFLAMLSHELRNPLAAVSGGLRLLDGPGGDGQRAWVDDMVRRQVGQLSRLTDDLLDVSRVSRGRIKLEKDWVDLRDVARGAVEAVADRFEDRGQSVALEAPGGPAPALGDSHRLEQVVVNLLTNAARYSEAGAATTVRVLREGNDVAVAVRDAGRGGRPGRDRPHLHPVRPRRGGRRPGGERARRGLDAGPPARGAARRHADGLQRRRRDRVDLHPAAARDRRAAPGRRGAVRRPGAGALPGAGRGRQPGLGPRHGGVLHRRRP